MVPRAILQQLSRLRWRERWLQLVWGASRWLAVVAIVLAAACLADWLIDLRQDTPRSVRLGLLIGQVVLWAVAAASVLAIAFWRRPSDSQLALWVEEQMPQWGHRLISAVQLNRPGALTGGMSPELIERVTQEAEQQAAQLDFAQVADHRRLKWSLLLLLPLALAAALVCCFWLETARVLLARQFLADVAIPRSTRLENLTRRTWPGAEEVTLTFHVRTKDGRLGPDAQGEVRIDPEGRASEYYPLDFQSQDATGAIYQARVPAASTDFRYHAWLKDGRTRQPAFVHYEARPVVQQIDSWVRLPGSCGYQPHWLDGVPLPAALPRLPLSLLAAEPVEEEQQGGDIVHRLPGSGARVAVTLQKPIGKARLDLLGQPVGGVEPVLRSIDLSVPEGGLSAEAVFRPQPGEAAYRIAAWDRHGFDNVNPPRRAIRHESADPPQVALLPEYFSKDDKGPSDEYEVEGLPLLPGERIRIGYKCVAPYGLSRAQLRYRVFTEDEIQALGEDGVRKLHRPWSTLPLKEVLGSEATGPFDPRRGVFANSDKDAQVWFHRVPTPDPIVLGGTNGGGRFDFQTEYLKVEVNRPDFPAAFAFVPLSGCPVALSLAAFALSREENPVHLRPLTIGDRIEFYVEAFDRNPDPKQQPGSSELRRKTVVTPEKLVEWVVRKDEQKQHIRDLEEKQLSVYNGSPDRTGKTRPPESAPARTEGGDSGSRPMPVVQEVVLGRSWLLLGPFDSPEDSGHARVYPPESGKVDLSKEYDGLPGKIRWKSFHSPTDKIDLEKFFAHGEAGVAYAACWIHSDQRSAVLSTGSDDGIKVWINQQLVLDRPVHREAVPGDDKTPIELQAGWSEFLVKVDNRFGTWAFFLDLLEPGSGKPLKGIVCRLIPPTYEDKKYVRNWEILGPFAKAGHEGFNTVYPPEQEPINLEKTYEGKNGKIAWKPWHADDYMGKVDFLKALGVPYDDSAGVAYAVCWMHVREKTRAVLRTGSHEGIKVWIGGRHVISKDITREVTPGSDLTPVDLQAGWHEVRVKVDNKVGRWGFCLDFQQPGTKKPVEGLEFRITPPPEGEKK